MTVEACDSEQSPPYVTRVQFTNWKWLASSLRPTFMIFIFMQTFWQQSLIVLKNLLSETWQINHTDTGSTVTSNTLFKEIEFFRLFEVDSSASTFQAQIPYPQKDMSSQVAKKLKVVTTSTENTTQMTWVISSRRPSSMIFFGKCRKLLSAQSKRGNWTYSASKLRSVFECFDRSK